MLEEKKKEVEADLGDGHPKRQKLWNDGSGITGVVSDYFGGLISMLKFEGVKKHYKDFELNLTMEVPEGYVTGLIGANGAGKSTAFKAALGLIRQMQVL